MKQRQQENERTCFQEAGPFHPKLDSNGDVAIIYGLNPTFETRLAAWRDAGYRVHVMTGVSWGGYQAYVRGEWDGRQHYDDAQAVAGGFKLEHGVSQGHDCFYMMPSRDYARYLAEELRRVVNAGAVAIHLEEPEFWVAAGYSDGFKREWQEFYGEDWQDPASTPDARYRAEKLKQHLYTRTIDYLCRELKQYAEENGVQGFRCYVPTHSLINYAHWGIVSPESRLTSLESCDGLIGQAWTGTSRAPNVYCGAKRERTLETGYCEYAALAALVRGTEKRLWQLADPIEDDPNCGWEDYRKNWECSITASLLVEESERFEIMPWPGRIFNGTYPAQSLRDEPLHSLLTDYLARLEAAGKTDALAATREALDLGLKSYCEKSRKRRDPSELSFGDLGGVLGAMQRELSNREDQAEAQKLRDAAAVFYLNPTDQRIPIPQEYATELQIVFNALTDIHWPDDTEWLAGQTGIALGISDTLMYQRGEPSPSDPDMSSAYGLALPLLKHGTALQMVQLERVAEPGYLNDTSVFLLTYEGQKPSSPRIHTAIADWVKRGGCLILFGKGDAYDAVREWWNQDGMHYDEPQEHLCETLGLGRVPTPGSHRSGAGVVVINPVSPAGYAHDQTGAESVLACMRKAYGELGSECCEGNALALRRGPYVTAAGMDESSQKDVYVLHGSYVNLFSADLPICVNPEIAPGTRWLLYDLDHCPRHPWVIAAAGRISDERHDDTSLCFTVESMADTQCAVRSRVPKKPAGVLVNGDNTEYVWDTGSRTVFVRFPGRHDGARVEVRW